MINKKEIATWSLITSLLVNITIGGRYIVDSNEYKEKIKNTTSSNHQLIDENHKLFKKLLKFDTDLYELQIEYDGLNSELDRVKKENDELKKTLKEREEVKNKQRQLSMELTFYGADCRGCSGITKSGLNIKNTIYYKNMRIVAADPRVIKLHSIIKIETNKDSYMAYVADTGGAIKGNILDVLVESEKESYKYGRQQAVVTIIKEGNS